MIEIATIDPFILKNIVFGIEDSIVSTTGVLLGVSAAKFKRRELLISGFILILVESLSMSYGVFLSDDSFLQKLGSEHSISKVFKYSLAMFISYFIVGLMLLSPYYFGVENASFVTFALALTMLTTLVLYIEKDKQKAVIITVVGALLMYISITVGKEL
jgi:VIT1/CCC1 family predicted Fe2+/Mn2+ transporter